MIAQLPTSLDVNGKEYPIKSDFRIALLILLAFNDPELNENEVIYIVLDALYGFDSLAPEDYSEALTKAKWFLDGGREYEEKETVRLMDWQQDESMIFSAVNNVAKMETRAVSYMHWWTWLGYFNEIADGIFSSILRIRQKKAKGKKLEKHELEFYQANKSLVDIQTKYTQEELEEIERLKAMLD